MQDGEFQSNDISATETLGAMCKGCGWRGGQHRPAYAIANVPACPGAEYDPADLAIAEAAQQSDPAS